MANSLGPSAVSGIIRSTLVTSPAFNHDDQMGHNVVLLFSPGSPWDRSTAAARVQI